MYQKAIESISLTLAKAWIKFEDPETPERQKPAYLRLTMEANSAIISLTANGYRVFAICIRSAYARISDTFQTKSGLSRAATASIRLATRCTWAYFRAGRDDQRSARTKRLRVFLASQLHLLRVGEQTHCSRWSHPSILSHEYTTSTRTRTTTAAIPIAISGRPTRNAGTAIAARVKWPTTPRLYQTPVYVLVQRIALGAATLSSYKGAHTLEGVRRAIAVGPFASQEAIKDLGNNGGGPFNANSAHPFENCKRLRRQARSSSSCSFRSGWH